MEWISVKDQKPPTDIPLLVASDESATLCVLDSDKNKDGEERFYMIGYGFGGYEWEYDFDYEQITHWMPLPKPPNE